MRADRLVSLVLLLRQRGRLAGELVLELLAGGPPRQVRLPTELVVRGSTGKVTRRRRR